MLLLDPCYKKVDPWHSKLHRCHVVEDGSDGRCYQVLGQPGVKEQGTQVLRGEQGVPLRRGSQSAK